MTDFTRAALDAGLAMASLHDAMEAMAGCSDSIPCGNCAGSGLVSAGIDHDGRAYRDVCPVCVAPTIRPPEYRRMDDEVFFFPHQYDTIERLNIGDRNVIPGEGGGVRPRETFRQTMDEARNELVTVYTNTDTGEERTERISVHELQGMRGLRGTRMEWLVGHAHLDPRRMYAGRVPPPHNTVREQRAKALFLKHLSPAQQDDWKTKDFIWVKGGESGKTYKIRNYPTFNVECEGIRLCAVLHHGEPQFDHYLAQKLMIEHNENKFLKIANVDRGHHAAMLAGMRAMERGDVPPAPEIILGFGRTPAPSPGYPLIGTAWSVFIAGCALVWYGIYQGILFFFR